MKNSIKVASFNVNGLRARLHQIGALIERHSPDIIGLQEIKVNDPDFPVEAIESLGYVPVFHGQKTHYGVALLCRNPPLKVTKGFPGDGALSQKRMIIGDFALPGGKSLKVINGYFPQGENRKHETKFPAKQKFYEDLQDYLNTRCHPADPVLVMGDFNIAPLDVDIGITPDNAKRWLRTGKCSFLPEERQWFNRLLSWGLSDGFRTTHPDTADQFSWFDYRSRGFEQQPRRGLRIDGVLLTDVLMKQCDDVIIDYQIRSMDKPSDHAPVIASFTFG